MLNLGLFKFLYKDGNSITKHQKISLNYKLISFIGVKTKNPFITKKGVLIYI